MSLDAPALKKHNAGAVVGGRCKVGRSSRDVEPEFLADKQTSESNPSAHKARHPEPQMSPGEQCQVALLNPNVFPGSSLPTLSPTPLRALCCPPVSWAHDLMMSKLWSPGHLAPAPWKPAGLSGAQPHHLGFVEMQDPGLLGTLLDVVGDRWTLPGDSSGG